jgi:hypothetical protein
MTDPERSQQLRIIKTVLKYHPRAAEAIATVNSVLAKAKFPIGSFTDLSESMGGDHTQVEFGGRLLRLAEIERYVPTYYFPIANENDLIAKFCDLARRLPPAGEAALETAAAAPQVSTILMEARAAKPEGQEPPKLRLEEIYKAAAAVDPHIAGRIGGNRR